MPPMPLRAQAMKASHKDGSSGTLTLGLSFRLQLVSLADPVHTMLGTRYLLPVMLLAKPAPFHAARLTSLTIAGPLRIHRFDSGQGAEGHFVTQVLSDPTRHSRTSIGVTPGVAFVAGFCSVCPICSRFLLQGLSARQTMPNSTVIAVATFAGSVAFCSHILCNRAGGIHGYPYTHHHRD